MQKIAFGVEYEGTAYSGWQRQQHTTQTIQEQLENAISVIASCPTAIHCAGRTDKGVHATGQVIHIATAAKRSCLSWLRGVNSQLPRDINIRWVQYVDQAFHARYSAYRRAYRYIINNHTRYRSAILRNRTGWVYRQLDVHQMNIAADYLLGEHDFSSFQSAACQAKTPIKTIHRVAVRREHTLVWVDVEANAFLHHMVRNIVGTLVAVGTGAKAASWIRQLLHAKDRCQAGVTASPGGLYLIGVWYPRQFKIPQSNTPMILL